MRLGPWLVAGLLCAPASPQPGWRDLTGEAVPEVAARRWLNTDGEEPTSASLKGKVWLLEFFATW